MGVKGPRGVELLQGEALTLFASGVRGAAVGQTGTPVIVQGERSRFCILLDVTAAASEVTDTLDAYIDVLAADGTTWLNAAHFTQVLGNGGAKKYFAVLDPSNPGTSVIDASADAAAGAVRPGLFGAQLRGRYTIVDGGGVAASFTFSVSAYAVGHPA
jgi:N-acyl-D-aspartate/D-glutamate deacylase